MISNLLNFICRIGIFILCANTILHFRPNLSYEKYLRLLVEMMVVLQVFLLFADGFSNLKWPGRGEGADSRLILEEVKRIQDELYGNGMGEMENAGGDAENTEKSNGTKEEEENRVENIVIDPVGEVETITIP